MFYKLENSTMALIVGDSANFSEHGAYRKSSDQMMVAKASDLNKLILDDFVKFTMEASM